MTAHDYDRDVAEIMKAQNAEIAPDEEDYADEAAWVAAHETWHDDEPSEEAITKFAWLEPRLVSSTSGARQ